ncbi:MAG: hypothetical protein WCL50_06525 [Spirochaetota bacterium]
MPAVTLVQATGDGVAPVESSGTASPSFSSRVVPEGKASFGNRLSPLLGEICGDARIRAVVIMPALEGTVGVVAASKTQKPGLIWILARSQDEALGAEAAADLVVDLATDEKDQPRFHSALAQGLCELARRVITGKARIEDRNEIQAALRSVGGFDWKVEYRTDPVTGIKARNHVIVSATSRK